MVVATSELTRFEVPFTEDEVVSVHLFDLDKVEELEPGMELEEERIRAEKFHKTSDARHFLARRVLLRHLLGERCGRDPRELGSTPGPHGRPLIDAIEPLRFNTSRSGRYYAVALVEGVEPGIDIELLRDLPDAASVARRIESDQERAELRSGPAVDSEHLLRIWTRKEAILKACGLGLSLDPTHVSVPSSRSPQMEITPVQIHLEESVHDFLLRDLVDPAVPEGLFAALALAMG